MTVAPEMTAPSGSLIVPEIEDVNCPKAVSDIRDAIAMIEIRMGPLCFIVGFLLGIGNGKKSKPVCAPCFSGFAEFSCALASVYA
jgi:hypothetical protein